MSKRLASPNLLCCKSEKNVCHAKQSEKNYLMSEEEDSFFYMFIHGRGMFHFPPARSEMIHAPRFNILVKQTVFRDKRAGSGCDSTLGPENMEAALKKKVLGITKNFVDN